MKQIKRVLLVAGCVLALGLGAGNVSAQRGNFDPAQYRQSRIDRYKEQMDVKDDAEWKVISESIGKVMDAQREVMSASVRGFMGGRSRGGGNGGNNNGDNNGGNNGGNRSRGGFGEPSPEADALQKAIDAKAPADEIKTKLAALRAAAKASEAKLEKSQDDLKKLLTARQEAVAVLNGLLK